MILIVFPDASPISEKILRLFQHIHNECFPSEQMHHSFSIVSTSKRAFSLLSKEEPKLYAHIQKVFEQSAGSGVVSSSDAAATIQLAASPGMPSHHTTPPHCSLTAASSLPGGVCYGV